MGKKPPTLLQAWIEQAILHGWIGMQSGVWVVSRAKACLLYFFLKTGFPDAKSRDLSESASILLQQGFDVQKVCDFTTVT